MKGWLDVLAIAGIYQFEEAKNNALMSLGNNGTMGPAQRLRISIDHHIQEWFIDAVLDVLQIPLEAFIRKV